MAEFFAELKRRHIYRVGAAYAVVAWALAQVVDLLSQVFELPAGIARPAVILLVIGFPVALIAAWMIESKPHQAVASAVKEKPTILDGALFGALIIVGLLVGYQQLAPTRQAGVDAARSASLDPAGAVSLAVLPFENLSADPDQEFFSAGMTEEITSALARIPDLRVVARTSAFQFKDQNRDIRAIAEALNATHLVEGSVRKAGTRLRITAQLINAESGVSIWTDNYDREYADVFAIQEDIATAIAGALRMPLGLRPGERLVNNRTNDLKAYEDYLRVRVIGALARTVPNARGILEEAVVRDPGFAPAWASLSNLYVAGSAGASRQTGSVEQVQSGIQALLGKAEMAARRATELDPRLAAGYAQLAQVQSRRANWAEAEKLDAQAFALDPDITETGHGQLLAKVGRLKEALQVLEQRVKLEPFVPVYNYNFARALHQSGQDAKAAAILEAMSPDIANYNRNFLLAEVYATQGHYGKAADTLLLINDQVPREAVETAARLLRTAPTQARTAENLPALQADLNFVYEHVGALERVMEFPERTLKMGFTGQEFAQMWLPSYAPLRKTERFKALIRNAGLFDYWKARGWPDLCRPVGADDFVCD